MIRDLWSTADVAAQRRLVAAIADGDLCAALLAIEGASDADSDAACASLDAWVGEVQAALTSAGPVQALRGVLVDTHGLCGDGEAYYDPDNSRLTQVIARRKGMPIVVSAVWVMVARAAGIEAHGVGLPGHFIARIDGVLVDPFDGGRALSVAQCRAKVAARLPGRPWDPAWLDAVSCEQIATRVLRNLAYSLNDAEDRAALYRTVRLLAGRLPGDPRVQLNLAHLTEEFGAYVLASAKYRAIAAAFDGTREAQIATIRAVELANRSRTLN